jgi:enoyl-CoA hydratase
MNTPTPGFLPRIWHPAWFYHPTMSILLTDTTDHVRTVTLNRPDVRNALSSELLAALAETMSEADRDPDVAVIILTGTDPAFCAGLDLRELGTAGSRLATGAGFSAPWTRTTKPVIGAVNGAAITGGFELALTCDFLVASDRARFADTHARVGIMPGWGMSVLLPRLVGLPRAVEMSLTGNFMGADEALAFGLVNHVVPHDELLPYARRLAADIAGNDQAGVITLLASYRRMAAAGGVAAGLALEADTGREWRNRRFDPDEVARRRQAVIERGRSQTGT